MTPPVNPLDLFGSVVLPTILKTEGGYNNIPADPGGPTNRGISLRAVVGLRGPDGALEFDLDHDGDVDAEDIKALGGHPEKVRQFYRERYWEQGAHLLRWPLCLVLMDTAVNHGPGPAAVMLQRALGVKRDGVVGPETARAANTGDPWPVTRRVLVERGHLYRLLTIRHADQEAFFDGWLARLFDLEALALRGPA